MTFKAAYKESYSEELSDAEAEEQAWRLTQLLLLLARGVPNPEAKADT